MADIIVAPLPPKSGLSIGFWVDVKAQLATVISTLLENTDSDDSHDASSNSEEQVNAFDPDIHTVTELQTAIDAIIDSLQG